MGIDISLDNNSGFIIVDDGVQPMPILFINPLYISCIKLIEHFNSTYQIGIILSNKETFSCGKNITRSEALFAIHEMLRLIPNRHNVSTEIPDIQTPNRKKSQTNEKQNHTDERMKNIEI